MFSVTEEAVGVHLLTVICFVNPMSLQNAQMRETFCTHHSVFDISVKG